MTLEQGVCPVCKQRLGVYDYMTAGTKLVCVNCETDLEVEGHRPLRLKQVARESTYNRDDRPESYA